MLFVNPPLFTLLDKTLIPIQPMVVGTCLWIKHHASDIVRQTDREAAKKVMGEATGMREKEAASFKELKALWQLACSHQLINMNHPLLRDKNYTSHV